MSDESNVILTQTKSHFCALLYHQATAGKFCEFCADTHIHTQATIKRVQKQIPQLKMVHENNTHKKKVFRSKRVCVEKYHLVMWPQ